MARTFDELRLAKEANPITEPQPYNYGAGGARRARTFSQVIAEATRGVDAGMNRFTPQRPDLSGDSYAPDWRGHYLGKARPEPTPFEYDPNALASLRPDQVPRFFAALTDQDTLEQREVKLSELTAMQDRVDPEKVANIRAARGSGGDSRLPVIVRANRKNFIADGHHRLTAALADGDSHARVRFKDIGYRSNALKSVDFLAALNAHRLAKYNPNHVPAGSPEGGQFASADSGALGASAHALFLAHHTSDTAAHVMARAPAGAHDKIRATEAALAQSTSTDRPVHEGGFKNRDGTWSASREALHREILQKIFTPEKVAAATVPEGQKPTVTFLGGRGGSGKSWLTGPEGPVNAKKAILLNSDDIKEMLPGYAGWNAALYHEESTDILAQADKIVMDSRLNVIYDATMKSEAGASARLLAFKNAGYDAEGYYMFTAPHVAALRATERFVRGGTTGRYVPIDIILGSTTNEKTFDTVKGSFSKWAIYDNNSPGGTPKLIAKSK